MSYTKEMCLYLLDNPDNIEAESLTESVERQIFQSMNNAISMRVGDRTPWRGQYARVTGDDEEHEDACPPGNGCFGTPVYTMVYIFAGEPFFRHEKSR